MKTTSRLAALGFGIFVSSSGLLAPAHAAPTNGTIKWMTDYKFALAQAKRLKKPMFIDFSTDWCSGCQVLAKTTFRDPKFVTASRDWVMVMINPEKSAVNAKLEKQYGVPGYPTLVFADSNGKVISSVAGAYPARLLLPKMSAAKNQLKSERVASAR